MGDSDASYLPGGPRRLVAAVRKDQEREAKKAAKQVREQRRAQRMKAKQLGAEKAAADSLAKRTSVAAEAARLTGASLFARDSAASQTLDVITRPDSSFIEEEEQTAES